MQGKVENSKVILKLRCVGMLRAHNLLKEIVVATRFLQLVPSCGTRHKRKAKSRARTEATNRPRTGQINKTKQGNNFQNINRVSQARQIL